MVLYWNGIIGYLDIDKSTVYKSVLSEQEDSEFRTFSGSPFHRLDGKENGNKRVLL